MPFIETFHGYLENTTDTLLLIEACRNGLLPTVTRRLFDNERGVIKSGTIIVFNETETGIKRWTDGLLWSPSRILGNFLIYRELINREHKKIQTETKVDRRERALVGSLTRANTPYNFKENGLIKKTIRILVNGTYLHVISYYKLMDVLNHTLPTPSISSVFNNIRISSDLLPHLHGYSNHSLLLSASVIQAKTQQNGLKRSMMDEQEKSSRKKISLPRPFDPPCIDNILYPNTNHLFHSKSFQGYY
ncbi:hypothetical protein G6F43_001269 [Rhizopus delemar]|nr:hypothetical protein G6F43_001269 [Rhizopus delemar]